jgi:hypothetical protein
MSDQGPLASLVAYQQVVVYGYEVTLDRANLTTHERTTLTTFAAQAKAAAAALRHALRDAGGTPTPPPNPATAPRRTSNSVRSYMRDLVTAEEDAAQSYYDALRNLTGAHHIAGAAAFMAAGGRRLVVLRQFAGEPLLPRAFETGGA